MPEETKGEDDWNISDYLEDQRSEMQKAEIEQNKLD
jgi:hypothetical protein